jgi:hypothetical protein
MIQDLTFVMVLLMFLPTAKSTLMTVYGWVKGLTGSTPPAPPSS